MLKKRRTIFFFNRTTLFIVCLLLIITAGVIIYWLNLRIMPTYIQYAEVQSVKVATHVVSKAINARTTDVMDVNKIIEHLPSGTSDMVTTKFNTEIINRVLS